MFKDLKCSELASCEYADINKIFLTSFEVDERTNSLRQFVNKMDRVVVMYKAAEPVAFMFFSFKSINGMRLINPGLTGKIPQTKNAIKTLGSYVLVSYFLMNPIWLTQRCGAIIIANNPRSYQSLVDTGAPVYPNIYNPEKGHKNSQMYREAIQVMNLEGVTAKGLYPNSMKKIGIGMKQSQVNYKSLTNKGQIYMEYVEHDAENALVALLIGRPLFDAPPYYIKLASKAIKSRLVTRKSTFTKPMAALLAKI